MKILKGIILLLTFCWIMLPGLGCNKRTFYNVTYEGHVYDKTGNLSSGAEVILSACAIGTPGDNAVDCNCNKYEVGRATTDASGYFHIKEKAARTNKYTVGVTGHSMIVRICATQDQLGAYSSLYLDN